MSFIDNPPGPSWVPPSVSCFPDEHAPPCIQGLWVQCDGGDCNEFWNMVTDDRELSDEHLRNEEGWSVQNGQHLCPDHN